MGSTWVVHLPLLHVWLVASMAYRVVKAFSSMGKAKKAKSICITLFFPTSSFPFRPAPQVVACGALSDPPLCLFARLGCPLTFLFPYPFFTVLSSSLGPFQLQKPDFEWILILFRHFGVR